MAFPFLAEINFELGDTSEASSEVDTESKLNVRHYSSLARRVPPRGATPFLGAYSAHIDLALGTADAYFQFDSLFDTAQGLTKWLTFPVWLGSLTMAASDRFTLVALQSAGPVDEITVGVVNNAGVIQLVVAETGATALGAGTRTADLIQEQWHVVEIGFGLDSGANDGTMTFYLDGYQIGAQLTTLTQAALTQARIGATGIDAGTTRGHILFDSILLDDTRIGPYAQRFTTRRQLTKSGHVAIGPGSVCEAYLYAANADNTMVMYDTDTAQTFDQSTIVPVYGDQRPVYFRKGLYVALGGTNPRGFVRIHDASDMSESQIKHVGMRR